MNATQQLSPWLSSSSSSSADVSKSLLTLLLRNLSFNSMNGSETDAISRLPPPSSNETRMLMSYFHQMFRQHPHFQQKSLFPYHSASNVTQINDPYEYMTCPSIQSPMKNVVAIILYLVVCIVGLFGNSLVIYVVLRFSKMQTVTNRYILNLAIADECFLIGIPFLLTTMYLNEWIFGPILCKLYMISTSITQFTSSIFLLIMSADRFIAVCHPISSPRFRTPLVSKIVSLIAWGMSALIMMPIFFYANTTEQYSDPSKMSCNILWTPTPSGVGSVGGSTFILYSLILGFALPLSLILVFYYLVIKKLQTVGPKNKSKDKKRSHRKVTRLVLTVITVYILCWSPYWVSQIALINSPPEVCKSKLEITIFILVGCLGYSNSAINPVLYAFLSDNFKKSFMKACLCARGKDLNAQLQVENSIFPKFGRSRGSEKLTSIAKKNLAHSKNNSGAAANNNNNNNLNHSNNGQAEHADVINSSGVAGGGHGNGMKESEAVMIAVPATRQDKKNINFSSICVVKANTTSSSNGNGGTTTTSSSATASPGTTGTTTSTNGCETNSRGQRTQILHTDL